MKLNNDTCVVVLSGGQDSVTCLALAREAYPTVHAVTFNYGQAHAVEIEAAVKAAEVLRADSHEVLHLPGGILSSTSPLVNNEEKLDLYENADALPTEGIEQTFVPMRNDLFLTIAANRAVALGAQTIFTGVSQEDFGGYPDCRATFIRSKQHAINEALGFSGFSFTDGIRIKTPLINLSKKQTVLLALEVQMRSGLPVWEALSHSHTCYAGQVPPCGKCHACLLRQRGFEDAGLEDPLLTRVSL